MSSCAAAWDEIPTVSANKADTHAAAIVDEPTTNAFIAILRDNVAPIQPFYHLAG
jgi:hypothetical protein